MKPLVTRAPGSSRLTTSFGDVFAMTWKEGVVELHGDWVRLRESDAAEVLLSLLDAMYAAGQRLDEAETDEMLVRFHRLWHSKEGCLGYPKTAAGVEASDLGEEPVK